MRIGILSDVAEEDHGGPANHIYNLIRSLKEQSGSHDIRCIHTPGSSDLYDGKDVEISHNPVKAAFKLRKYGFDIIHFNCISTKEIYVYPWILDAEYVATQYGDVHFADSELWPQSRLTVYRKRVSQRLLSRIFSSIMVSSESMKQNFISGGIGPDRLDVVYPAADPFFQEAEPLPQDEKDDFLLHVSSLQPTRKNPETLLRAYEEINKRGYNLPLKIGGRNWNREIVEEYVESPDVRERVQLIGEVSQERLRELYRTAKVYLAPTRHEGFGLTPLEAMACGAPVISNNVYAVSEVVGDAGILVDDPDDVEGFAKAIQRLLDDTNLRRKLSRKGMKQSERFSWEKSAEQVLKIYEML